MHLRWGNVQPRSDVPYMPLPLAQQREDGNILLCEYSIHRMHSANQSLLINKYCEQMDGRWRSFLLGRAEGSRRNRQKLKKKKRKKKKYHAAFFWTAGFEVGIFSTVPAFGPPAFPRMRQTFVPHFPQTPSIARMPFFHTTSLPFWISTAIPHFIHLPVVIRSPQRMVHSPDMERFIRI